MPKPDPRRFWIVTLGSNTKRGLVVHSCLLWSESPSAWYARECIRIDRENDELQQKVSAWESMGEQIGLVTPPVGDVSIERPFAHLINIEEVSSLTAKRLTDAIIYPLVEDHHSE